MCGACFCWVSGEWPPKGWWERDVPCYANAQFKWGIWMDHVAFENYASWLDHILRPSTTWSTGEQDLCNCELQ